MQIGLKERLIGAVVLVILAVIIVPWVLKGGSAPSTTVTRPLALPQATTAPTAQTIYHMALNGPTDSTTGSATSATRLSPAVASSQPAPPMASQPVVPNSYVKALAPAPAARTPASGKWVVQAGSYSNERNALRVEHKLVKHGYHAYVSRYRKNGRTFYRVRVGPYSDRAAAEHVVNAVARAYGGHAEVVPDT